MAKQSIYTVGGTVQAGGGVYIPRPADDELLERCLAGDFCYVLTARQMGKSSLMVRTAERLAEVGARTVLIDLTELGTDVSLNQWYLGIIYTIVEELDLDVDYKAWWEKNTYLGETQRFNQFLRQVILEAINTPIVIFIDEIDTTLSLGFPADDFFAAIRANYNARAKDPAYQRLTFVLLGVAQPTDLIRDSTRTPFNIGVQIDLTDFTLSEAMPLAEGLELEGLAQAEIPDWLQGLSEAMPLAEGLELPTTQAEQVLKWILNWTGGHPYLTQRLCKELASQSEFPLSEPEIAATVERLFFRPGSQDHNLRFVRDMLTREPNAVPVLNLYHQIRSGQPVPDDERMVIKIHLKLSGVVRVQNGNLVVRNKIYECVFDSEWVIETLRTKFPELTDAIKSTFPTPTDDYMPALRATVSAQTTKDIDIADVGSAVTTEVSAEVEHIHPLSRVYHRLTTAIHKFAQKWKDQLALADLAQRWGIQLARADLAITPGEYAASQIISAILMFLVAFFLLFSRNLVMSVITAIVGGFFPHIYVRLKQDKRLHDLERQLGDTLDLWANSLRSGYSVLQAMETISRAVPDPIATEFRRVVQEVALGINMEDALTHLLHRVPSGDLDLIVTAVNIQHEVGGNLAEILEVISYTIRERVRLASETVSFIKPYFLIFLMVAAVIVVLQWAVFPAYFSVAWEAGPGRIAILTAYGLLSIGMLVSTMSSQNLHKILIFELGAHWSVFWRRLALDLFLGGLSVAIAFRLSVPPIVLAWMALMLLYRATVGFRFANLTLFFLIMTVSALYLGYVAQTSQIAPALESALSASVYLAIGALVVGIAWFIVRRVASYVVSLVGPGLAAAYKRIGGSRYLMSRRLAEWASREPPDSPEELNPLRSFTERVLLPYFHLIAEIIRRFTPQHVLQQTQQKSELMGYSIRTSIFWGESIILSVFLALFFNFGGSFLTEDPNVLLVLGVCGAGIGYLLPTLSLSHEFRHLPQAFIGAWPDALDLLTICVEAGLGFDSAIAKVYEKWDNELAVLFGRIMEEIQSGKLRREVLRDVSNSLDIPDFTMFAAAVIQADQLGVSISKVLRVQSEQMRTKRWQRIQNRINNLDLQQDICLHVLLSPTIILWLIAPVIAQVIG